MRAARMHAYNKPLVLEEVPIPEIEPNEVLVKVGAAGMCRTDVQLLDGYFRPYAESTFPLTPGHEIAGTIDKIGGVAAKSSGFEEGDQVVSGSRRIEGHLEEADAVLGERSDQIEQSLLRFDPPQDGDQPAAPDEIRDRGVTERLDGGGFGHPRIVAAGRVSGQASSS